MRAELYDALRAATEGEFQLLGELDCDDGWIAYLAAGPRDGELAILILRESADDGQFDLPEVRGDVATVTFNLNIAYDRQRRSLPTRATLRRSGGGWTLQEARDPR